MTERGRAHLTQHGFDVVSVARLEEVRNIYEETAERAYAVANKLIDRKQRPFSSAAPGCRRWQCSRFWRTTLASRLSPLPRR